MKKKLATLVAMLALLLLAFAPLVLAQTEDPSSAPPSEPPPDVPADPESSFNLVTPTPGAAVGCQDLYGYSTAFCQVNGDGLITLPDGSTAAVLVQPDGASFIVDESGNLIPAGTSAPPVEDPGFAQYDSALG